MLGYIQTFENNFLSFLENYNMITEDFLMSQEKEAKAEMCFGQGNFASSRKYFKESISLMKESRASAENCAHLYLRLGDVYLKLNKLSTALAKYSIYLELVQSDDRNLWERAKIHYLECIDAYQSHKIGRLITASFAMAKDVIKVSTNAPVDFISSFRKLAISPQLPEDVFTSIFEILKIYLPIENKTFIKILESYRDNILSIQWIKEFVMSNVEACCNNLIGHVKKISRHDTDGDIMFILEKVEKDLKAVTKELMIYANWNGKIQNIIDFLNKNIKDLSDRKKIKRLRFIFGSFKKIKLRTCSDTFELNKAIGWFYRLLRQFDISQYYFNLCKEHVTITSPDEQKKAEVYEDLGYMHLAKNECVVALEYFMDSLAILDCIGKANNNIRSKYYLNFARCYELNNSWCLALDYYLKILYSLKNENYLQVINEILEDCHIDLSELPAPKKVMKKIYKFNERYDNLRMQNIGYIEEDLYISDGVDTDSLENKIYHKYKKGFEVMIIEAGYKSDGSKWVKKIVSSCSNGPILSAIEEHKYLKLLNPKGSQFLIVNRLIDRRNEMPMIIEIEMEQCEQTLIGFFYEKIVEKDKVFEILNDLALGFLIMKQQRLVHGDISPENILVSLENKVKIADLGSVQKIEETSKSIVFVPNPNTKDYRSPEMYIFSILTCEHILCNPCKSDVFSLGLTILSCIGVSILGLNDMLGEGALTPSQILFLEEVNRNGCPIIGTLITEDQEWYFLRTKLLEMKIEEALQSIRSEYKYLDSILQKMLVVDYEKRCNFDELTRLIRTSSIELA